MMSLQGNGPCLSISIRRSEQISLLLTSSFMADRYMIDNCDFVVAVTVGDEEPDAVEYAKGKEKQIVYFDVETLEVSQ